MNMRPTVKKFQKDDIRAPQEIKSINADYLNQIVDEIQKNIGQGPEFEKVTKDFKKFATHFMRKYE